MSKLRLIVVIGREFLFNTDYPVKEVVLRYKELWQVESIFRDLKNVFKLGPVFHRTEEKGRRTYFCKVFKFCSF